MLPAPLHFAALYGHLAFIGKLLAGGADPRLGSSEGITPLHNAAVGGHVDAARALLVAGASPDVADTEGNTPAKP